MDFFERQDQARRNTKLLVVYFVLGVAMLILAVYAATLAIFTGVASRHHHRYDEQVQMVLWNPQLFLGAAVGTLAVIALGSGFKTLELAQGGSTVATMLGGRLVDPSTSDPDERKLRNVVEEMALAAGVPVPQVYLLPDEHGINAFAAGHSTSDAVVAVTAGAVKLLSRDELQGVIGHEFSHILNGDMRLNLRLMGVIFGILCLAVIGRVLLYTRSSNSKDKNPLPLLGLALLVIGWIGVFFGRLIKASVSRQREFLADASSVQFTRNPDGIGGALRKIGGLGADAGGAVQHIHAETLSHMFLAASSVGLAGGLLASHPPLRERLRRIYGRPVEYLPADELPAENAAAHAGDAANADRAPLPVTAVVAGEPITLVSPLAGAMMGATGALAAAAAGDALHASIGRTAASATLGSTLSAQIDALGLRPALSDTL